MAKVDPEISDIVKKCKILLLDIEGTTTSISFVKDKLFPYAEENVKSFLDSQWESNEVKEVITALRKLALEDQENSVDGFVTIPGEDASKEDQIEGLVNNVKWQMSSDRKVGPLKQLQGLIWKQGYDKGEIKGHVYDDVLPALEQWKAVEGQKVYIYSSGSVQAQKLLFGQSSAGDLLRLIDGHFDTAVGAKQASASYNEIAAKIDCKPDEILFLTDIVKEAEGAQSAGIQVALVKREGNSPLPDDASSTYPVLHSLAQLTVSNKRKPDAQEQELPAKVPKTIAEDIQKDSEVKEVEKVAEVLSEKPEKMDVEEEVPANEDKEDKPEGSDKAEEKPVHIETVVEEITDSNEVLDVPMCNIEPVIEENIEKMDTDKGDDIATDLKLVETEVKNSEIKDSEPIVKETTVITEIEEISSDKEVDEIIENLEPIVEEPATVEDMDVLQNVGEVLEKECDDILSKVQNVTNLENIPIKPLLNTITEENIDTENTDSNDIVNRILETETELEIKQCADIDNITDVKAVEEEKNEKAVTTTEKIVECESEEEKSSETKVESSSNETKVDIESEKKSDAKTEEIPVAQLTNVAETTTELKESVQESKQSAENGTTTIETEVKETQINGKTTNGVAETNGDASKEDVLCSRLSVANGKEAVYGANGNSTETEQGQGDGKSEIEIPEIKVKTVATEEPLKDPLEEPTEA